MCLEDTGMSLRLTCARTSVNMDEAGSPPGTTPSPPFDSLSRFFPMSSGIDAMSVRLHVLCSRMVQIEDWNSTISRVAESNSFLPSGKIEI